jgi:hypothetical protein
MLEKCCLVTPLLDKQKLHRILGILAHLMLDAARLRPGADHVFHTEFQGLGQAAFLDLNTSDHDDHFAIPE